MSTTKLNFDTDGAYRVLSVKGIVYYVEDDAYGKLWKSNERNPGPVGHVRWINGEAHYLHSTLWDHCYWAPCKTEAKP